MFFYFRRLLYTLTRTELIIFYVMAALFAVSFAVSIWLTFYANTTVLPAPGGEYTEGLVGQPTAINPMGIGSSEVDNNLVQVLFADLITLSQRVATSTTGRVWVVTLKDDMVWSDGKAITADDVLFTVHTIQNSEAGSPLFASWQGVTVERVSQREVRFTLKAPYAYFLDNLKNLRIAPAHIFELLPPANIRLSDYNLKPVTSGPYSFVSYEKERSGLISEYHLAASNNYPGTRALIENVNFKFFPTYTDALFAFNNKAIDGLGGFDASNIGDIKINYHLHELALPHYYAVFFNPSVSAVLKDKAVREALTLATDKQAVVEEVFDGHANVAEGPLSPKIPGYDASVYSANRTSSDEANALLDKNQWKVGSDGVRARTVGRTTQRLDFEIVVPDLPFLTDTAELIKEQWQKVGVRLTIKTLSPEEVLTSAIRPRSYQMLLYGNILRANSDLFSFWHSSQRFQPGLNLAVYENRNVDKFIDTTRKTFDEAEQNDTLSKIQLQINTDKPAIFLFSPTYLYASPTDLGGFDRPLLASPQDRFTNINSWFLETSRVFK